MFGFPKFLSADFPEKMFSRIDNNSLHKAVEHSYEKFTR